MSVFKTYSAQQAGRKGNRNWASLTGTTGIVVVVGVLYLLVTGEPSSVDEALASIAIFVLLSTTFFFIGFSFTRFHRRTIDFGNEGKSTNAPSQASSKDDGEVNSIEPLVDAKTVVFQNSINRIEAAKLMLNSNATFGVVVDDEKRIVGVVELDTVLNRRQPNQNRLFVS